MGAFSQLSQEEFVDNGQGSSFVLVVIGACPENHIFSL